MIRYFISYLSQSARGLITGNAEISLTNPVVGMADVEIIKNWLVQQGVQNPTVLSFCRFDNNVGGQTR